MESDLSEHSDKSHASVSQIDSKMKDQSSQENLESSREEGECTRTLEESQLSQDTHGFKHKAVLQCDINEKKTVENEDSFSSFIDTSREEGECSSTSVDEDELETTIKAFPDKTVETCLNNKENVQFHYLKKQKEEARCIISKSCINKKRKRSLSDKNENTPKRQHLFLTEGMLSPISFLNEENRNNCIVAETPLIESKVSLSVTDTCSSTPISTEQKFLFPKVDHCSTPISGKQTKAAKKEILKRYVLSTSDSDSQDLSDLVESSDEYQTVEELINEITQLCEDSSETVKSENDEVSEQSNESLSKIKINDLIHEWKTRSICESSDNESDKTLTENSKIDDDSDVGNITVLAADGKKGTGLETDDSSIDNRDGRFKSEVTVSRIEEEKINETNREAIDMDICDTNKDEIQAGGDLLNLNDYDDEGFIDENILENSHLMKDVDLTIINIKSKETTDVIHKIDKRKVTNEIGKNEMKIANDSGKGKGKKVEENVKLMFTQDLQKGKENVPHNKEEDFTKKVVTGWDYAAFDTSICRKHNNTALEKEVCRRWGTHGSADPDVNLTVAATKWNKYRESGEQMVAGILEGNKVVCTSLYEEEVLSRFKSDWGKTAGQSDLCYMTLEVILGKLYNQREILDNMNKMALMNIKSEIEWELQRTKARQFQEIAALRQRQCMEGEMFRCNSRNVYNAIMFQNNLMQLNNEHIFQESQLRQHHQYEYNAVRSHGMDILNAEISRQGVQSEPIEQLIVQLENPDSHNTTSPRKHGPPIVVSLRKAPCRTTGGKHSTVAVCLSAGIAQAVSLEDDLYDHYYKY